MVKELTYTASVDESGQTDLFYRESFLEDLRAFSGERVSVLIKRYRRSRTTKQNAFYFGNFMQSQMDCFKERWGYSYNKTQVHDWNKANFWADDHIDEDTGEVVKLPASSTDNTTVEWEEKMDIIRTWFMEKLDWALPFPEQQSKLEI